MIPRALEGRHPAFAFLAAFAEASAIGGLADWYAVVALFRRPLGLPIPHTAIIPNDQQRIAEKLGEFIEEQFLDAAPVEAKLNQTDFASFFSEWLDDRKRSGDLARFMLRLMPEAIAAAKSSGLKSFVARRAQAQLQSIDFTPLAAGALRTFVTDGGHQRLLDDVMAAVHQTLNKPETLAAIREKIRANWPFVIERLETDRAVAAQLAALERNLLSRPEVGDLAARLWSDVKTFIARSASLKRLSTDGP